MNVTPPAATLRGEEPPMTPSVTRFVRAALGPDADGTTDAELLARFAAGRDEAAFELLVWRHAGMVLRVCRGVVRDHHAAEDATQAVFLALARQAGAVGRRGAVAGWLYRVARRVAARAAKRQAFASGVDLDRLPGPPPAADPEASRLLHAELDRLPDRYRTPVLLCYFEGLTHADAARRLGWPVGTVATRVMRAKARLHRRLTARGVTIPAAGLAVLAGSGTSGGPAFAAATARLAVAFVGKAGGGVSPAILALAKGEFQAMTAMKLQWAAGVIAACGALTFGGVWAVGQGPGTPPAGPPPAAPTTAQPKPVSVPKPEAASSSERKTTASQTRRSTKNLKLVMIAFLDHYEEHDRFPTNIRDKTGKPLLSWRVRLLPYLNQAELYRAFKLDEPWDSEHNSKLLARMPDIYRVGFEPPGATHTYYQMMAGSGLPTDPEGDGRQLGGKRTPPDPGDFNGITLYEAGPPVPWTKPADIPCTPATWHDFSMALTGPFFQVRHEAQLGGSAYALPLWEYPRMARVIEEGRMREAKSKEEAKSKGSADAAPPREGVRPQGVNPVPDPVLAAPIERSQRPQVPTGAKTEEQRRTDQLTDDIQANRSLLVRLYLLMTEQLDKFRHDSHPGREASTQESDIIKARDKAVRLRELVDQLVDENHKLRLRPEATERSK